MLKLDQVSCVSRRAPSTPSRRAPLACLVADHTSPAPLAIMKHWAPVAGFYGHAPAAGRTIPAPVASLKHWGPVAGFYSHAPVAGRTSPAPVAGYRLPPAPAARTRAR